MTKLLLIGLGATAALSFASCAPLHANAMREDRGSRVHGPDYWGSGRHTTNFSPSRPSANGFETRADGTPC